jgi:phosphopantothenoylcysteine decarboxylase/phosphopantothenate--cysteine ligase
MLFAPAMNDKMWANPAVQENVKFAEKIGVKMIGPGQGRLACGSEGIGRMAEPLEILEAVVKIADGLKGKRK